MNIDDLQYIFRNQISSGETKLVYLLEDGGYKLMDRCLLTELDSMVIMLSSFMFNDYVDGNKIIPRFSK